jgi:phosphate acetyltransferase
MNLIDKASQKIKGRNLKLVMPEGRDPRVKEAAAIIESRGLASVVMYEDAPPSNEQHWLAVQKLRPKLNDHTAARLLSKPLARAGAALAIGQADAMLAGVENTTGKVIEAALMTIGLAPGIQTPSSYFLMQWPDRQLIFADCAVNAEPSAEQLADIARATEKSAREILEETPRLAFLSFSTAGSAKHARVDKVAAAVAIIRKENLEIVADGEMQVDAALSLAVAKRKLGRDSEVGGRANVLIFPDLDSGNIAYKIAQYLGGAQSIGPVLQGFAKPVSDLSRGASVDDIVATATLLLLQATTSEPGGSKD